MFISEEYIFYYSTFLLPFFFLRWCTTTKLYLQRSDKVGRKFHSYCLSGVLRPYIPAEFTWMSLSVHLAGTFIQHHECLAQQSWKFPLAGEEPVGVSGPSEQIAYYHWNSVNIKWPKFFQIHSNFTNPQHGITTASLPCTSMSNSEAMPTKRHLFRNKHGKRRRWGRKSGLEALLGGFETQASKTLRDQRGSFQPILLGEPWRKQRIQALDFLHQTAFRHVFANGHVKKNEKVWTISLKIQGVYFIQLQSENSSFIYIVQSSANFQSFTSILPLTLFWGEGWVSAVVVIYDALANFIWTTVTIYLNLDLRMLLDI